MTIGRNSQKIETHRVLKDSDTVLLDAYCIMHDQGVKYEEPRRGMHLRARNV